MKILMVNKFLYPRGGAETYMLRIGEELTRRGHQVEYFGMYDEKNTVGNAEGLTTVNMDFHASGAEKLLYPFRIIYSGEARRKMRQVIDRFHPDIIHFNNINFQLTPSVILAGAEKNIPMVQTVHDLQMLCPNHMMMEFGTWKLCEECSGKKCKMACVRKKCIHGSRAKSLIGAIEGTIYTSSHVYDRVARYICPSRFMEKKLLSVPRYAGKTTMIHNFLSKTAEINAPKGDYVLYFGRLSEEKGIDRILAACRLLPEIPFDFERDILERMRQTQVTGKKHFIIIVSEGVIGAQELANQIQAATGVDSRATVLGHIQRGGSPTVRDRVNASLMGYHAIDLLDKGIYNRVVAVSGDKIVDYDVNVALSMHKTIDRDMIEIAKAISI